MEATIWLQDLSFQGSYWDWWRDGGSLVLSHNTFSYTAILVFFFFMLSHIQTEAPLFCGHFCEGWGAASCMLGVHWLNPGRCLKLSWKPLLSIDTVFRTFVSSHCIICTWVWGWVSLTSALGGLPSKKDNLVIGLHEKVSVIINVSNAWKRELRLNG